MNRDTVKSYSAEGAIAPNIFIKPGAADYGVLAASAVSSLIIGVSVDLITVASGESVDVIHEGIANLKLGGTVTRGDKLTSDASGYGVTAAPAAGTNNQIGAVALVSGVSGDIIPVLVSLSTLQG